MRRKCVAYIFEQEFQALRDKAVWGGIEANVRSRLSISDGTNLKPVFEAVLECIDEGQIYDGSRQHTKKLGRPPLIPVDSPEAQIIANAYKSGFGHIQVLWLVNQHAK
jgi:hypothetical protein